MNRIYAHIIKFFSIIVISGAILYAQDVNDALRLATPGLGSNARALGMGNSYISLSDDASAAFFNPAGFGLLKRLEFSGGLSYQKYNNDASFFGTSTAYSNSETRLDRLSFAFPLPTTRGSLVFGLSYHNTKDLTGAIKFNGFNNGNNSMIQQLVSDSSNIPFDLLLTDDANRTPINGRLQQSGSILSSGGINNWTFSGAIEVYRNVFVGGNLNIISGSFEANNDYYEDDVNNLYQGETATGFPASTDFRTFYFNRLLKWDLSGWDAKVGILYQLKNNARFGFTVQFPKTYTVSEDYSIFARSDFSNDYRAYNYSDKVKYDIVSPYEIGAGLSVNLKGLILSADATLIDYSQTKFDNPDGISDQYIADLNKRINDELTSVFNYNAGVEYTFRDLGLRLRAGYFVQPSAYKNDPAERDKKFVTVGVGFLTEETIGLDLGYAHGWWKDIGDNYSDVYGNVVSRYNQDIAHDKMTLTATYRF